MNAGRPAFPVRGDVATDRRFENLARDVSDVLARHAYPRPVGEDRDDLEYLLSQFLYGERAALPELKEAAS